MSEDLYHAVSVTAGTLAGLAMLAGFVLLLARRETDARVRATTTRTDRAHLPAARRDARDGHVRHGRREPAAAAATTTARRWPPGSAGCSRLDPDTSLIAGAPLVYRIHAATAWLLYALWPFSRLVHAWSVPVGYLGRSHILYRSRRRARGRRRARPAARHRLKGDDRVRPSSRGATPGRSCWRHSPSRCRSTPGA